MTTLRTQPRYDGTLRVVMWLDAFWSVAFVLAAVVAVPVAIVVPLPDDARFGIGVVVLVTAVFLALCGAVTGVLFFARMARGHYDPPAMLRLPLPRPMRPEAQPEGASSAESIASRVSAAELMKRLAEAIDAHQWDELPGLLHPEFTCRYVHTGESFDRDAWVRLNADYPGFQRFILEDCVAAGQRAVGRAHVTAGSDAQLQHFEVATFIAVREGLIADMTEVWTDLEQTPSDGTRTG